MTTSEVAQILAGLARVEEQVEGLRSDNIRGDDLHADHEERLRKHTQQITDLKASWRSAKSLALGAMLGSGVASGGVVVGVLKALGG